MVNYNILFCILYSCFDFRFMKRIINNLLSLLFPRTCIGCKRVLISAEKHICIHCRISLPLTNFHKGNINILKQRLSSIHHLNQAYAYLQYNKEGIAQKMLHKLKYNNNEEIGHTLGLWMGYEISNEISNIDIIIPVPLHEKKLALRGFNQCDSICMGLSEALTIPWLKDIVIRSKFNTTQTKKTKIDRWINVEQLFLVTHQDQIKGKHILIVDDVITTGATIESISNVIIESGAKCVSVACIASGQ